MFIRLVQNARHRLLILLLITVSMVLSAPAEGQYCTEEPCESATRYAPQITLAPQHEGYADALQGSATAAYSTPAYVSLDQPRSLTLLYGSGLASPAALIQVDAHDPGGETPARMSIRVMRTQTGAWMTFTNGGQELFYSYAGGAIRLSAQFETGTLASGAHDFTVVVRGYWPDGTWRESTLPVRVLVVNARSSPYGMGWIVAGVQWIVPGNGGVYVHEGDGSARWFQYPGTCVQGTQTFYCGYVSPDGEFSRLARNTQTGDWERFYPESAVLVKYRPDGRMYAVGRTGAWTLYAYDADGRLSTVTDPAGLVIRLGYDAAGRLAWIRDPGGRQVEVRVLASGLLDRICDPVSCALAAGYDARQRMSWLTDRGGARWDYEYDAFGKLARATAPGVQVDGQGTTRPATRFTTLEAATLPAPGSGTSGNPAPHALPGQARLSVTDARGNVATYAVDRFGNPLGVEEPLGRVTGIARDQHGRPTRVTAFNGDVTEYTYQGRLPATVRDVTNDRTTTFSWTYYLTAPHGMYPAGSSFNYPVEISTPGEPTLRYELAGFEPHATRVGATRFYVDEWDSFGLRPAATYGPGAHTRYHYAASGARNLDSVSVIRGVDTLTTRFTRDGFGRVTGSVDPEGVQAATSYDALNRVLSQTGPGGTTTYAYAPAGWLQTVTDPRLQQFVYQRNALGWLQWERDPRGKYMYLAYDALGRQVGATNRRGQTVRYGYDALGQLTSRTTHEGAVTTWSYAPDGRWMAVQNGESSDTVRTLRGTLPSVDQVTVRNGIRYSVNTRRDVPGNYSRVLASWGYNVVHHYENDESGRLRQLLDMRAGTTTSVVRDTALNRTAYVLPSGDSIIHGATETRYTDPSASGALSRYYRYDEAQRLLQRGPTALTNSGYSYDTRWQLAGELTNQDGNVVAQRQFTWDGAGNPTHAGASVTSGNRLEGFDGYTLTYDDDGNLLRKYKPAAGIDWSYEWNSLGQLVAAGGTSDGALTGWNTISYGYDGSGRRVRKTVNGVTTRYLYDGQHVIAETDGTGNVSREFTWYEGVDRPHSMRVGGQTYYYVSDHQGNVTGLVNAAGTLVNRYEYTPFGAAAVASEGVANPVRFAGGRYDAETGLYFNRTRYYDPALQRFTSEDPLGLGGGMNVYAYAGNNPVGLRDPAGMTPCEPPLFLVNGRCIALIFVLPPVSSAGGSGMDSDWFRRLYAYRDHDINLDDEIAYLEAMQYDFEYRQASESRETQALAAVRSARAAADLGVGLTPGASTLHDASVALTGRNIVTGERVGWGGRGVALIGAVMPGVSGGGIRGGGRLLKRFGLDWEDAGKLASDAANALARGFPHGVSFTSHVASRKPGSIVSIDALRGAGFPVEQTGSRASHYTVHLPQPVTDEVADLFNQVLGRSR